MKQSSLRRRANHSVWQGMVLKDVRSEELIVLWQNSEFHLIAVLNIRLYVHSDINTLSG